jgi:hypothetical protein
MGGLVWLASYPKSGNTWTRAFLHNLLDQGDKTVDINAMHAVTTTDNSPAWFEPMIDRPIVEYVPEKLAALRPKVHQAIADASEGLIFVKTHNALVSHAGVPMITTRLTAGAVYIVRNPLDVAVSYSHHMGTTVDDTIALMAEVGRMTPTHAKGAYQILGSWSENVMSWTRRQSPSLFVMRYEDMQQKPRETFGALAGFMTLKPSDAELDRAIELSSFERLKEQEQQSGFREKPASAKEFFRKGQTGEWRKVLTRRQVRAIIDSHREQMGRFGYLDGVG